MSANIEEFPGTPLRQADLDEGNVLTAHWKPRLEYGWDAGVAISRYLAELKNGRIIGITCKRCRRTVVPPRVVCEWCWEPMDDWVYLKDRGTVNTFSICYIRWDASRAKTPQIPAVIEIDGASKGAGILHLLDEVDPDDVSIGMRVQAVWKPAEERTGSITDIKYFKPL
ncbi:MAG: DNA-binding protein [Anaerolineae bacterium]|nr:DNA-binding protein [Anaerolineae bacterium]NIN94053.1 DNA-binding protein [Anaerolineae bacterium]NIQ77094.1 DNA-binding protein [Anaerolineae bacterium]